MVEATPNKTMKLEQRRSCKGTCLFVCLVRKIEAQFIKALPPFWQHFPDYSNLPSFPQLIKLCTLLHCTEPKKQATFDDVFLATCTFMSHRHTSNSFEKAIYSQKSGKRNCERKTATSWMLSALFHSANRFRAFYM